MNQYTIQEATVVAGGGSSNVNVDSDVGLVHINSAAAITLAASYTISATGTAKKGMRVIFIHKGDFTTDTATGKHLSVFGKVIPDEQALKELTIQAYYDGSAWEVQLFPSVEGSVNIDGAAIKAASIPTAAYELDSVTNVVLNDMTRGTVKVGGTSNVPTDLNAKTSGYFLYGDGTDLVSGAISGDITISSSGVSVIGDDKITAAMLAYTPVEYLVKEVTLTTAQVLALFATPVEIISNPGENKMIALVQASAFLDYNSKTYANGGNLSLVYSGDTTTPIWFQTSAGAVSSTDAYREFTTSLATVTNSFNTGLSITNETAAFITGDSPLRINVVYYIYDVA